MNVSGKIDGVQQVSANLSALAEKYGKELVDSTIIAANIVRSDAVKSIQEQSSGDVVTRYRAGGESYQHTASKPGDAPNTDTGRLVGSVKVEIDARSVSVGTSLQYGQHLETGTARMKARPWLYPALERNRAQIMKLIRKNIDKITAEFNRGRKP